MSTIATIPRYHTARTLVGTMTWLKAEPDRMVRVREMWPDEEYTYPQFREWFFDKLTDKINREQSPRGRKDCDEWFFKAYRLARKVNTPRLIVREYECPQEYRTRLQHRFFTED